MDNILSEARIKKGLTQLQMANLLKIAVSTYNQYENQQRNIPRDKVNDISSILNIDINDFFIPLTFTISKTKNSA